MKTDKCQRCGATIHLVKTGKDTYKWVTDPEKGKAWRCGYDRDFPLRSHSPKSD